MYFNGKKVTGSDKRYLQSYYGLSDDSGEDEDNDETKSSKFGIEPMFKTIGKAFRGLFWDEIELPSGEKQLETKKEVKAFSNGPVAYVISANVVGQFGHGVDGEIGYVIIVKGADAGKVIPIQDLGYGGGNIFSLSLAGKGSAIFYTGSSENFTLSELLGGRTEANFAQDISKFLFLGAGGMVSDKTSQGENVIGVALSFGVQLPVFNYKKLPAITINYGSTQQNK